MDVRERSWLSKIKRQIRENPLTGKPLGSPWFREKKFEDKRLYYLVSAPKNRVLLVSFGNKKNQQKIIEHIRLNELAYRAVLEKL